MVQQTRLFLLGCMQLHARAHDSGLRGSRGLEGSRGFSRAQGFEGRRGCQGLKFVT